MNYRPPPPEQVGPTPPEQDVPTPPLQQPQLLAQLLQPLAHPFCSDS